MGSKTDWVNYRQLKEGEVILETDEVFTEKEIGWVITNPRCVGGLVPNPQYSSHRIYRRKIQ